MKIIGTPDVRAFCRVVHLVRETPDRIDLMHDPVPEIDAEFEDEKADQHLRPGRERTSVKKLMRSDRAVPHIRGISGDHEVQDEGNDPHNAPISNARKGRSLPKMIRKREAYEASNYRVMEHRHGLAPAQVISQAQA